MIATVKKDLPGCAGTVLFLNFIVFCLDHQMSLVVHFYTVICTCSFDLVLFDLFSLLNQSFILI